MKKKIIKNNLIFYWKVIIFFQIYLPLRPKQITTVSVETIKKIKEKLQLQLGKTINDAKKLLSDNNTNELQKSVVEANAQYLEDVTKLNP